MSFDVNTILQLSVLALVAVAGTLVVLTRDPFSQTIGLSFFGLMLALMFFILQAPDVALSQIVVGAVALPLMVLLALARIRRQEFRREQKKGQEEKS
ncbi:MAG TPA: hydrogenase subunit MbhD domain-containing protein [Tepidisphaeraceae bacterium]|nr:hydrogenase subunit MbhD domain-containing protein [Tepidisphaeraceae bacterium]